MLAIMILQIFTIYLLKQPDHERNYIWLCCNMNFVTQTPILEKHYWLMMISLLLRYGLDHMAAGVPLRSHD